MQGCIQGGIPFLKAKKRIWERIQTILYGFVEPKVGKFIKEIIRKISEYKMQFRKERNGFEEEGFTD